MNDFLLSPHYSMTRKNIRVLTFAYMNSEVSQLKALRSERALKWPFPHCRSVKSLLTELQSSAVKLSYKEPNLSWGDSSEVSSSCCSSRRPSFGS